MNTENIRFEIDRFRSEEHIKMINDAVQFGAGFALDGKHVDYRDVMDVDRTNEAAGDVAPFINEFKQHL